MKTIDLLLVGVLALMCIVAGAAKLFELPQEIELLRSVGIPDGQIFILSFPQMIGGILVIFARTRVIGCVSAGIAMAYMTVFFFTAGEIGFGWSGVVSVLLTAVVAYRAIQTRQKP